MDGFVGVILAGVAMVAGVYVLINHAGNAQKEAAGFTKSYGKIAKTFQGD